MASLAAMAVCAPAASASSLLSARVSSPKASFRACSDDRLPSGGGFVQRSVTASKTGWVTARLKARGDGDWDLAIFEARSGDLVAGSSGFTGSEVASGIATAGQRLAVQACRLSGSARSAALSVELDSIATSAKPERLSLVRVVTPNRARKRQLTQLGLDLTEHGGDGFVEVLLHGAADARQLRAHKFLYSTEIRDVAAQDREDRAADARYARRTRASAFPSGRATYRRLSHYGEDMKKLVRENPGLVKPIVLRFKTWTGMSVEGIEITTNVDARDGKPVFLQMGAHHAREWPSSEHAMEWAFELVNGYKANNPRVRSIVSNTRTIVIPLVNPEGFNTSREGGEAAGAGNGRGGPEELVNIATVPYEYHRKNCRVNNTNGEDPQQGNCQQQPSNGLQHFGVDPNRNYGGFWGGDGATPDGGTPPGDYAQDYRGNGPFSEPETRNVRDLVSKRHVTTLITNHTFSNLLLRPPGIQRQGPTVDEPLYKALGDAMAGANAYASQPSYMLYDTTGGTEDWTYYATGGLGFTFEIGPNSFHPPFAETVAEYEGAAPAAGAGRGGNREAYFKASESTANAERHSVLSGAAPSGAVLRLKKSFKTSTSPVQDAEGNAGSPILFDDTLDTTMETVGSSFRWHINPSTRPIVAQGKGRPRTGDPSPPVERPNNPAPVPPCPAYFELGSDACLPTSYKDEEFIVPANGGGVDNGFATPEINWNSAASDFDMEIYRDRNDSGTVDEPDGEPIATSAQGTTSQEKTTIGPDPAPGRYFARVVNYAGADEYDFKVTFSSPDPYTPPGTENWRLTCESFSGTVLTSQDVFIARGERKNPGLQACTAAFNRAFATGRGCDRPTGRARRTTLDRAKLGRDRVRHLRTFKIGRRSRSSIDRFCFTDRRQIRIGYPSGKLRKKLGSRNRRRYTSNKAVLVLTSSKKFKIRGVRVGSSTRTLRRRIGRLRGVKVGRNTWYAKRGSKSRLVFKVRGRKVYEIGIADRGLNRTRASQRRFFNSFR